MNVVYLRPRAQASDAPIARALEAMRANPSRRWTVAELAALAGLSRAAFARRFRRATGVTPLRHLTDLRMRFAAEALTTNADKLAAIAALVGYTSEFAFAKAFKRAFGISPGSFRNASRVAIVRAAA
jgi:transcriptional regulator GlxA family with amidase domain